ncbi:hypothetical protein VTN96DRAFT_1971 [Rasamsonia emersonii]
MSSQTSRQHICSRSRSLDGGSRRARYWDSKHARGLIGVRGEAAKSKKCALYCFCCDAASLSPLSPSEVGRRRTSRPNSDESTTNRTQDPSKIGLQRSHRTIGPEAIRRRRSSAVTGLADPCRLHQPSMLARSIFGCVMSTAHGDYPPSTSDDVLDDARQREHGRRSGSDSLSTSSQAPRDLVSSLQTRGVTSSSTLGWQPKLERFLVCTTWQDGACISRRRD